MLSHAELNVYIGRRIRLARVTAGMSQTQLGACIGVVFQQIHKYEYGRAGMSVGRLVRLAAALRCSVTDLLPPDELWEKE